MKQKQVIPKFKIGDPVVVIKYGHCIFMTPEKAKISGFPIIGKVFETMVAVDMSPDLIGQKGVIKNISINQQIVTYALDGPNKVAWYDEKQLKKLG